MELIIHSIGELLFYFFGWLVVCGGTYLAISYFLISDCLQSKTDKTLFYVNEHGRKYPIDSIRIFVYSLLTPLLLIICPLYIFGYASQIEILIAFGTVDIFLTDILQ